MQVPRVAVVRGTLVQRIAPSQVVLRRFGPVFVVLLMMTILTILQPAYFMTRENLTNVARQISSNALLALGEFVVILTAGIDLSVGAVSLMEKIVLALTVQMGW